VKPPRLSLRATEFFVRQTRTRFPFRYGIASMTEVPHLFLRVRMQVEDVELHGLASEGLPPKWFTKDPATTFEQDLPAMLQVIGHAAALAREIAARPVTFFELWAELERQQKVWAGRRSFPPLLSNHGVSLVERAVLDGFCRALSQPLHRVVRDNLLGMKLGEVYPELAGAQPRDFLPTQPLPSVLARHTVGLADPLSPADLTAEARVDDGLPQDLESCIRTYGLRAFKIKLWGDPARDFARLTELQRILEAGTGGDYLVTLDGNENFKSFAAFREFWSRLAGEPAFARLLRHVVVVEQPVHRDHALSDDAGAELRAWRERPPLIIDESDGEIGDLPRALELGYVGTSHKNCKGIVKGLANACLLARRRGRGAPGLLTGEDLANLGPVALLQDLAMMALLGIAHVERNGHHYFRGLSVWPVEWQAAVLAAHPDLYTAHATEDFATLRISNGILRLDSVNHAPFGYAPALDPEKAGIERADFPALAESVR
jgi:hypothetical protein